MRKIKLTKEQMEFFPRNFHEAYTKIAIYKNKLELEFFYNNFLIYLMFELENEKLKDLPILEQIIQAEKIQFLKITIMNSILYHIDLSDLRQALKNIEEIDGALLKQMAKGYENE
jgi:hypothetical protein